MICSIPSPDDRELISSFNSKSATLNKLLPIRISGYTILGLVDSGNSFYNAISLAVANKIGLTQYQAYHGPPVGTAQTGSHLTVVGIIKSTTLRLTDETGKIHKFASRLVVVKHLSCGTQYFSTISGRQWPRSNPFGRHPFLDPSKDTVSTLS